jgi:hypothetical protein
VGRLYSLKLCNGAREMGVMLSAVRWPNPYGSKNVDDIGLDRSDESRGYSNNRI